MNQIQSARTVAKKMSGQLSISVWSLKRPQEIRPFLYFLCVRVSKKTFYVRNGFSRHKNLYNPVTILLPKPYFYPKLFINPCVAL